MTVLIISPKEKARVAEIRAYAELEENVYKPGPEARIPGDHPEYVLSIGDVRAVFSISEDEHQRRHRHMSASLHHRRPGLYPAPIALFTLAAMFGFTGAAADQEGIVTNAGLDWVIVPIESPPIIVIGQPMGAGLIVPGRG